MSRVRIPSPALTIQAKIHGKCPLRQALALRRPALRASDHWSNRVWALEAGRRSERRVRLCIVDGEIPRSGETAMRRKSSWTTRYGVSLAVVVGGGSAFAQQFDAPYYELEKKHTLPNGPRKTRPSTRNSPRWRRSSAKNRTSSTSWWTTSAMGSWACRGAGRCAGRRHRSSIAWRTTASAAQRLLLRTVLHADAHRPHDRASPRPDWPDRCDLPGQSRRACTPEEVTLAEVLSEAGYATAMYGKWHFGEGEETWPHSQGFDETLFGLYNAAPWAWNTGGDNGTSGTIEQDAGVLHPGQAAMGCHGGQERMRRPGRSHPSISRPTRPFEEDTFKRSVDFIKRNAGNEKPFFLYWASNLVSHVHLPSRLGRASQHGGDPQRRPDDGARPLCREDSQTRSKELGIAENTLVVWMSDNGPMLRFLPGVFVHRAIRGGKGDVLEGGVHVPAVAWWPGVIEPNQISAQMLVHVTDMYTTAARIGGALDGVPKDRVIDGLEQSSYLMAAAPILAASTCSTTPESRPGSRSGWASTSATLPLQSRWAAGQGLLRCLQGSEGGAWCHGGRCSGPGCRSTTLPACIMS